MSTVKHRPMIRPKALVYRMPPGPAVKWVNSPRVPGRQMCAMCHGRGGHGRNSGEPCRNCGGDGFRWISDSNAPID